ncbi:patatin-like phospholipase family protein [Chengkuizengella axinellae]|uniref:Patatin-like phospholipase family protein n=1 Tax=Chengkuizengella axinellae TaxID=3064388 RepID=A0ABT9J276_9BACL|nr:patatin-like phospholipase family protein [Chengkuizengella sp. 2205SS18-9]MDP5275690.1 patatin-like phospholipase family protein [Chengkuizengella sp. 2205SS18-9]
MKVNAVFEGGGVKAIGLAGAVKAVEDQNIVFNQVAGTSSGAIVASLIAAGYTSQELKELVMSTPFSSVVKKTWVHRVIYLGPGVRVFFKKGLYSGDPLEEWIDHKLKLKGVETFGDLNQNQLRIIASDITRGRILVLPDDIRQYGINPNQLSISKAIRMSTAIPFYFDPIKLKKNHDKQTYYIVDGGILSNYPLWLFDKEARKRGVQSKIPTLGFRLIGKHTNVPRKIIGPISMFQALFSTMMDAHDEKFIEDHKRFNTIQIPTLGVRTTDFKISNEECNRLFESGYRAAEKYISNWSYSEYLKYYEQYLEYF